MTNPSAPWRTRGRRCLAVLAAAAGLTAPRPDPLNAQVHAPGLRGQGEPAAEVRVFETVQPETGRRSLHVMEGLSPGEIQAVQNALRRAGFGAAWREGVLDPFTRGGLQSFQTRCGLTVCACVSLETLIELGLRTRVAETIVLDPPATARAPAAPGDEADYRPPGEEREPKAAYINYGRYYPFGVIYLTPFIPVHGDPAHGIAVTHGGRGPQGFVGVHAGGLHVGAAVRPSPAVRAPLVPFGRVPMPPNVVRSGH